MIGIGIGIGLCLMAYFTFMAFVDVCFTMDRKESRLKKLVIFVIYLIFFVWSIILRVNMIYN